MIGGPILCSAVRPVVAAACALAACACLSGCGQRGPLYLPQGPAAAGRATLPEVLLPTTPSNPNPPLDGQVSNGGTGTAAPGRTTP